MNLQNLVKCSRRLENSVWTGLARGAMSAACGCAKAELTLDSARLFLRQESFRLIDALLDELGVLSGEHEPADDRLPKLLKQAYERAESERAKVRERRARSPRGRLSSPEPVGRLRATALAREAAEDGVRHARELAAALDSTDDGGGDASDADAEPTSPEPYPNVR